MLLIPTLLNLFEYVVKIEVVLSERALILSLLVLNYLIQQQLAIFSFRWTHLSKHRAQDTLSIYGVLVDDLCVKHLFGDI